MAAWWKKTARARNPRSPSSAGIRLADCPGGASAGRQSGVAASARSSPIPRKRGGSG